MDPVDTARVLVVGEALVDVRVGAQAGAQAGEQAATEVTQEHPGGSPLNIAVALGRLGVPTTLAAQLGTDARGEAVARHLASSGVELVRLAPQRSTSTATAHVGPGGSATYDFDLTWDPEQMPDPRMFALVHVGSIGAALAPGADAVAGLVDAASSAGVPVSLDPNVRPAVTPDLDDVRRRVGVLARAAALVKLSDEDAALLLPGADVDKVAADLAAIPAVRLAVLTCGADGLLLRTADDQVSVPTPAVDVADTIGAGDTVTAALIAALLSGTGGADAARPSGVPDLDAAVLSRLGRFAAAAAAVTCSRPGADPPWRTELRPPEPATIPG